MKEKIIHKNLNNDFYFKLGERNLGGKKYFMHIDVFNYNKEVKAKMVEGVIALIETLKKNNINELYFLCDKNNDKLLKFASLFLHWEYISTLTLKSGNEYNILIYRF